MIKIKQFQLGGEDYTTYLNPEEITEVRSIENHQHFPEVKSIVFFDRLNKNWLYSTESADVVQKRLYEAGYAKRLGEASYATATN